MDSGLSGHHMDQSPSDFSMLFRTFISAECFKTSRGRSELKFKLFKKISARFLLVHDPEDPR